MITDKEKEQINNYMNNNITNVNDDELLLIHEYKDSLDDNELISMTVAINVLGPSFDIKKSQGYLKWKEKNGK